MKKSNNVIVGAGLNGLVLARIMQKKSKSPVVLIDAASSAGGLFQSWTYPEYGTFDYGVHVFQDTGVIDVENTIRSSLHENEWQDLTGYKREIAGLFFNGRLQLNTAFLDLRCHEDRNSLFGGMLDGLNDELKIDSNEISFEKIICNKFGRQIFEKVITPIVERKYGYPVSDLQKLASTLTPFHRVVLFDEKNMPDLMASDLLRARLGYPEQKRLPSIYESGLKSYYPKKFGMQKVINGLASDIVKNGGAIFLNSKIVNLDTKENKVESISFEQNGAHYQINDINQCLWTAALPSLYFALGGEKSCISHADLPPQTWILNLASIDKPKMADLYFFYSYLENGNAFRISNPANYSQEIPGLNNNYFSLCVEAIFPHACDMTPEKMTAKLLDELEIMGVLCRSSVVFSDLKKLPSGFPAPTIKNAKIISEMRNFISEKKCRNIIPVGVQAEPDLFYYRDILRYSYEKYINSEAN